MRSRSRWLGAGILALVGCKNDSDVKFVRDAPTSIAAGETYAYTFHVTRAVKKGYFLSCDSRERVKVDRDSGKVSFLSSSPESVKICAEYHVTDGPMLDKYEVTVDVGERRHAGSASFPKPVAAAHEKLRAALAAVEAGSAAPTRCPKVSGVVHAYQLDWLAQLAAAPTRDFSGDVVLFAPPAEVVKLLREPERDQTMLRSLIDRTHVVVVKDALVMPRYERSEGAGLGTAHGYTAGTFSGSVHLVELGAAKVLCKLPLAFRSSKKLELTLHKDVTLSEADVAYAATDDFETNGRSALTASLRKAAPGLQVVF